MYDQGVIYYLNNPKVYKLIVTPKWLLKVITLK